jgi:hypothetical protein
MAAAAQNTGGSLSVHEVLRRWAPAYLQRFGAAMPSRQREVLQAILTCRTPALGGALHYCPNCDHRHFSYHSCNDRHCPQCGGLDAQAWLEQNTALLLPVPYFLVTFTVPEGLRRWMRSHPSLAYNLLPVKALSDRCRTLFRQALQKQRPEALAQLPPKVWTQRWVSHSAAVGSGHNALRYLSRYVFKTATGNRQLQLLPQGRLRWPFRHSGTGAWCHIDLEPFEFIRRFLQHVLPLSFHRVRRFGWLHPAQRVKLNRVRALLQTPPQLSAAEQQVWQPPPPALGRIRLYPHRHRQRRCCAHTAATP